MPVYKRPGPPKATSVNPYKSGGGGIASGMKPVAGRKSPFSGGPAGGGRMVVAGQANPNKGKPGVQAKQSAKALADRKKQTSILGNM